MAGLDAKAGGGEYAPKAERAIILLSQKKKTGRRERHVDGHFPDAQMVIPLADQKVLRGWPTNEHKGRLKLPVA
jgi:hypothetical protein